MNSFSVTDTGITREMNQDFCFALDTPVGNLPNLYIVADGMGGHKAGDYASRNTVERVVAAVSRSKETNPVAILEEAITRANGLLFHESEQDEDKTGMGTTLVIATISGEKAVVANVGDSRLYFVGQKIMQITRDHSMVQEMVRAGKIQETEAKTHKNKNIITRAIGALPEVEVDYFEVSVRDGDKLLLCSDGLTNMVEDSAILEVIHSANSNVDAVKELITKANQNGGLDNITALLVEVE